jgi:dolichol-phosphate mannosyltransferase
MCDIILIPTYNERSNMEELISKIFTEVPEVSVIIVDDNSPDRTGELVEELKKKYKNLNLLRRKKKEGLGKAYIHAFQHVLEIPDVRTVVMMDADLSHPPEVLPLMLEEGKRHSVVIGSRYIKGGKTVGWEMWRRILSFGGNKYCRLVTRMNINDCTGGFNLIHADLLRKVDFSKMDMSGYAFMMELKYILSNLTSSFTEIPIVFRNRLGGESKISSHIISEGILAPWKMISRK